VVPKVIQLGYAPNCKSKLQAGLKVSSVIPGRALRCRLERAVGGGLAWRGGVEAVHRYTGFLGVGKVELLLDPVEPDIDPVEPVRVVINRTNEDGKPVVQAAGFPLNADERGCSGPHSFTDGGKFGAHHLLPGMQIFQPFPNHIK